jgi:peptidoglycan/LPS O-acetylase OafA/YrhL
MVLNAAIPHNAAAASKSGFHIPSLDGLRALSFMLVFVGHGGAPSLGLPVPGGLGVTIFFFLSGFLITTLLRVEHEKTGSVSLWNFYLRRSLRILPPFYLVLVAAWAASLIWGLSDSIDPRGVLAQALHYVNYWAIEHTYDGLPVGTSVYWSLAVEEHFYLLFPLVFMLLTRARAAPATQAVILLVVCAVLLAWRIFLVSTLDMSVPTNYLRLEIATDTRFDAILLGCVLAVYGNPSLDASRFNDRTWKYVLLPLGIAGLTVSLLVRDDFFRMTLRHTLQGISLIPVFVCAVRYPDLLINRPLNLRPVAFIGTLSYSLYLVHQVVIAVVNRELPAAVGEGLRGAITLGICIAIAWSIYLAVERPCAQLRRNLRA